MKYFLFSCLVVTVGCLGVVVFVPAMQERGIVASHGVEQAYNIEVAARIARQVRGLKDGDTLTVNDLVAWGYLRSSLAEQPEIGHITTLNYLPPVDQPYCEYQVGNRFFPDLSPSSQIARFIKMQANQSQ